MKNVFFKDYVKIALPSNLTDDFEHLIGALNEPLEENFGICICLWHCIWHEGKPYDYHLILDNYGANGELLYEVDIYSVPKLKKGEWANLNDLVYLHTHTLPFNPNLFEKGEIDE